jgi:hypothetical protein
VNPNLLQKQEKEKINHIFCVLGETKQTMIGKERMSMSRGKNFNHKEKGHPGNLPNNRISEEKEHSRQYEQIEDIVTHEAFKNREKEDEMP